jgi:hypothetical protein
LTVSFDKPPEMNGDHHGVVLVLTNSRRSHYLLQRKDATYPHFPRHYSFFGGGREQGESEEQTLERELIEELCPEAAQLIVRPLKKIYSGQLQYQSSPFQMTLFEAVCPHESLELISTMPVLEGERAELVTTEKMLSLPFVWGLETLAQLLAQRH